MIGRSGIRAVFGIAFVMVLFASVLVPAGSSLAAQDEKAATGGYFYYDGSHKKTVQIDESLVAEFGTSADTAVQKAVPEASSVKGGKGLVTIWRVDSRRTAMEKTAASLPSAKISPVFHQGGTAAGRMMALPGNIIVTFRPEWTDDAIRNWAGAQQLEVVKKLPLGKNVYVLKSGPGLESLNTANRIHQSGDVVSAMPDWWMESHTK